MILLSILYLFAFHLKAQIIPDVCQINSLYNNRLESLKFKEQLNQECQLQKKYKKIESNYQALGLSLTQLTEYQVMRYTQRSWFIKAKEQKVPVEKIYQPLKSDYLKPIEQRSTLIWDNWTQAIESLPAVILKITEGHLITLDFLRNMHRSFYPFYPLFDEKGDFSHDPHPGLLKPTLNELEHPIWWSEVGIDNFKSKKEFVDNLHDYYISTGLVTKVSEKYPSYIDRVLDVRMIDEETDRFAIYSGHSMTYRQNLELLIDLMNQYFSQWSAFKVEPQTARIQIKMTPAEFAFFVQQYFVRLHPFYEGNGRMSRALQELILGSFGLPHGSSGDLMDIDVFTEDNKYYQQALQLTHQLLGQAHDCLDQIILSREISYECQILQSRESSWSALHKKNQSLNNYLSAIAQLEFMRNESDRLHYQALKAR